MTDITFTGSGTLSGTGTQDGPATVTIDFTPQGTGGTYSCAPSGASLTNSAGTWTWGAAGSGGWLVLLNGASAANGSGKQLYLLSGDMWLLNTSGAWWKWQSTYWLSVNPPSPLPPTCP